MEPPIRPADSGASGPRFASREAAGSVRAELERLRPLLRRSAGAILRRSEDIEDAVQEASMKLLRFGAREEIRVGSLEALARTTARRVALDQLSKRRPVSRETLDPAAPERAEALEAAEVRGRLRDAVERLPDSQRTAFLLVFQEGLSHEDAARELDVSADSLRARLYRARQQLRVWLKDLAP